MELKDDQKRAAARFEAWLTNSKETFAGLWASAGFGKSYTAKHLINEVILKNSNYIPIVTSMTHSAVDILSEFTGMTVTTLHKHMGWVPQIDKETGEGYISTPQMRDPNCEPKTKRGEILLVDEAGLMGHTECRLLKEECERTGLRVLLIGDHKQCFPVIKEDEEMCIPAYNMTECILELTIPKRTDLDNTIYKLSVAYRATVDGARQPKLQTALNKDGKTGVRICDDIEEMAYAAFRAGVRDGNTDNIKVLAFTNIRCLNLNRKIRKKVLGHKSTIPVVGEIMVANSAITLSAGDDIMIRNNQLVKVVSVEETESFGLRGAFIQYEDLDGVAFEEIVFVPASPQRLAERLKTLSSEAKGFAGNGFKEEASQNWRMFFSLKEGCSDIRYTYAMTINKAQGITLKHALVDLTDINSARSAEQAARLAYTGVTRATTYVTIEGSLDENF